MLLLLLLLLTALMCSKKRLFCHFVLQRATDSVGGSKTKLASYTELTLIQT